MIARNYSKCKALYYLGKCHNSANNYKEHVAWSSIPLMSKCTGVPADSLRVLLPRWHKWDLVRAHVFSREVMDDKREHVYYRISTKGLEYINNMRKWFVLYDEAIKEVESLAEHEGEWYDFANITFYPEFPDMVKYFGIYVYWPFTYANDVECHALRQLWGSQNDPFIVRDLNGVINIVETKFNTRIKRPCLERLIASLEYVAKQSRYMINQQDKAILLKQYS